MHSLRSDPFSYQVWMNQLLIQIKAMSKEEDLIRNVSEIHHGFKLFPCNFNVGYSEVVNHRGH